VIRDRDPCAVAYAFAVPAKVCAKSLGVGAGFVAACASVAVSGAPRVRTRNAATDVLATSVRIAYATAKRRRFLTMRL
jgi:hypothetical protein